MDTPFKIEPNQTDDCFGFERDEFGVSKFVEVAKKTKKAEKYIS